MTKDKAHWVLTAIFWLAKVIKAGRLMGFFTQWCDAAEKIEKHLKLNWTVGSEKWISVFHLCDSGPRSLLQSFFSPPLQLAERTNDKPDHPSRVRAGWQTAAAAAVTVKLQQYGSRMTVLWPWRDYIHHHGQGADWSAVGGLNYLSCTERAICLSINQSALWFSLLHQLQREGHLCCLQEHGKL